MTADLDTALAEATAQGRAVIARCSTCGETFWHPRGHCPECGARTVELVVPAGPARVYTATTNRRPRGGEGAPPVQVGYVEFPEGVRMLVTLNTGDRAPVIGEEVVPVTVGEGESMHLVFRSIPGD